MAGNIGASLRIDEPMRADHFLYSESQGRYLLCCRPENSAAITAYCRTENLHLQLVGQTAAERLTITQNGEEIVDLDVASLRAAYEDYLPAIMKLDE
jgi:phosphoribosylformylglycinamidine (FGAM) synthase-like enzyme